MSIVYACVFSRRGNLMLLESTLTNSYTNIVRNKLIEIQEGINTDSIKIDAEFRLVYTKTKELILIVYSKSIGASDDKELQLISKLKEIIVNDFGKLNDFDQDFLKDRCFQRKLYKKLNHLIKRLNSGEGVSEQEIDLDGIDENSHRDKLLEVISSQETNQETSQQTVESGNPFCSIRNCSLIVVGLFTVCGIIYIVASLMKCKSLNLFCFRLPSSYKNNNRAILFSLLSSWRIPRRSYHSVSRKGCLLC